jgi:hypothetical protein
MDTREGGGCHSTKGGEVGGCQQEGRREMRGGVIQLRGPRDRECSSMGRSVLSRMEIVRNCLCVVCDEKY